jgi:hypothetical protein
MKHAIPKTPIAVRIQRRLCLVAITLLHKLYFACERIERTTLSHANHIKDWYISNVQPKEVGK